MGDQNAPRLSGDKYQHLYSWWLILSLKMQDEQVKKVIIENGKAGQVDDVTLHYEPSAGLADRFYQIKYHADQGNTYSADELIKANPGKQSLLEKFWATWKELRKDPDKAFELYLVSNWAWDNKDPLGKWVSGLTDKVKVDDFMAATPGSNLGKIRQKWQNHLGANDEDLRAFLSCLHFRLGYSASVLLHEQVVERMKWLQLKTDSIVLKAISSLVSSWIEEHRHEIDLETLNTTLINEKLYLPDKQKRYATIHLATIEKQTYAVKADHVLDWRDYFIGDDYLKGHQLKDPSNWNALLLPEFKKLKAQVNEETDCRLVKAQGQARLSAWFAFGYVFSQVAKYTIEVGQKGWCTDVAPNKNFTLITTGEDVNPLDGEFLDGEGDTVAIGISIKRPQNTLDRDIKRYLDKRAEKVAALLLLRSNYEELQSAGDAAALANEVKNQAGAFVKRWDAQRLLLFYIGPAEGACFIGHKLSKVSSRIQIMEYQNPGYAPSFLLT